MANVKSRSKARLARRMEIIPPAKRPAQWGEALGTGQALLASLNETANNGTDAAALANYEVRFSEKTPRGTERRDGGSWGIYLRDYNVRVATFSPNCYALRTTLSHMFDAAYAIMLRKTVV